MQKKTMVALAAGISLFGASVAQAATLNAATNVTGVVNTVMTGSSTSSVDTSGSVDASTGTGVQVNADASTSADTSTGTGMAAGVTNFTIMRGQTSNSDTDSTTANISSASQVNSNADLQGYVSQMVQADPNFDGAAMTSDGLDVDYSESAHYLGFIPGHIKTTVHVDNTGKVSVSYPWYSFLASTTDKDSLQTSLQAQVGARSLTDLNAQAQAHLIDVIHDTLSGSVSASSDTSASVSTQ